jgi:hypothetical protein
VDCSKLGSVDSITFYLSSSDVGSFGMNTPAFFCMDNFTTGQGVGINEINSFENLALFPNPANAVLNIRNTTNGPAHISIYNSVGSLIRKESIDFNSGYTTHTINIEEISNGLYFIEIASENKTQILKFIKH